MEARSLFWRDLGNALVRRYAQSYWALLGLLGVILVPLSALYLVRGVRMVRYAVAAAVAVTGLAFAFSRPYYTLLAAMFIGYSTLDLFLPGPVAWGLLAVAAGRVFYDWLGGTPLEWGSRHFKISTAVLLAIVVTSLMLVDSMERSMVPLQHVAIGLLMYVAISGLCTTPERVRALLVTIALAFSFQLARFIAALVSIFGSGAVLRPTGSRLALGDPNITAVIASSLLIPLVHLTETASWRWRIVLIPVIIVNVLSIIITTSRIGMLALALACVYLLVRSRYRVVYAVTVAAALLIFFTNVPARYWTRFISLGQMADTIVVDRSLLLRMHALEAGWQIFMDHFWTGVGFGNFGAWSQRYMSLDLRAHNTPLDVAATLGIFGLAAYVYWVWSGFGMVATSAFGVSRRSLSRGLGLDILGLLAVIHVASLTLDYPLHYMFWWALACANALRVWETNRADRNGASRARPPTSR